MNDRRARVARHNSQDIKTYFTAEEKAKIFGTKKRGTNEVDDGGLIGQANG